MARVAKKKAPSEAPPPAPPAGDGSSKLSKFQAFVPGRVSRRVIKNAPYNPRTIDEYAAKRLRKVLKEKGLVEALVWNKRTGNLVGGHQRIAQLDTLEKRDDYELDVCIIDVPLNREKALNVILNNPAIQGGYDADMLGTLVREVGLEAVEFDQYDAQQYFEGTEFEDLYKTLDAEGSDEVAEQVNAIGVIAAPVAADAEAPNGRLENGDAIRDPERHAAVKAEREAMRERITNDPQRQTDFYIIVVCSSNDEAATLGAHLGARDRYVDGRVLFSKLGIELPTSESA